MWVRGHSRSLKLVSFQSLGTVSYSLSIVTMAVSVAVCEIFSVKSDVTLKTGLGFVQGHWKWHHLIDRIWSHMMSLILCQTSPIFALMPIFTTQNAKKCLFVVKVVLMLPDSDNCIQILCSSVSTVREKTPKLLILRIKNCSRSPLHI